jgi:hypothetical protein
MSTAADVIGDYSHLENEPSAVAQEFIRKVALSSPCPIARNLAVNMADSRSLRVGEAAHIQSAEVEIGTNSNRVGTILTDGLTKCRQDKRPEFSKINEDDFGITVSDDLTNGDISTNPYAQECARKSTKCGSYIRRRIWTATGNGSWNFTVRR